MKLSGEELKFGRIAAAPEGDTVLVQLDEGRQVVVPVTDLAKALYELRVGERVCVSFWFGECRTLTGYATSITPESGT